MSPDQYPKRILLCITGLSPQIVTETLYALTQTQQPPFMPTQVIVISTADGAERTRLELLSPDRDWFGRLCRDYQLPPINFDARDIRVIRAADGEPLSDIRTPDQNTLVADQVSDIVRELTADEHCAIHASIAGGRKTMGFYLGYAMSLYGRPQDRLSHVLIDPGFEGNPEFFYPTRETTVIYDRDRKPLDSAQARVMLADIPFVRLRDGLPEKLLAGASRFSETVAFAQRLYHEPALVIDSANQRLRCADIDIPLTPVPRALYTTLAIRAHAGDDETTWDAPDFKQQFLDQLGHIVAPASGAYEKAEHGLQDYADDYFAPHRSRINRELQTQLGAKGATPYLIRSVGPRGAKRYGLALHPDQITLTATPAPAKDLAATAA